MKKEEILAQPEAFKKKYGEYPVFPIRAKYAWRGIKAEGDIKRSGGGIMLFGFPGIVDLLDDEVQELEMLYDGDSRWFPNVSRDDVSK